jgi:hypothetical protein
MLDLSNEILDTQSEDILGSARKLHEQLLGTRLTAIAELKFGIACKVGHVVPLSSLTVATDANLYWDWDLMKAPHNRPRVVSLSTCKILRCHCIRAGQRRRKQEFLEIPRHHKRPYRSTPSNPPQICSREHLGRYSWCWGKVHI